MKPRRTLSPDRPARDPRLPAAPPRSLADAILFNIKGASACAAIVTLGYLIFVHFSFSGVFLLGLLIGPSLYQPPAKPQP